MSEFTASADLLPTRLVASVDRMEAFLMDAKEASLSMTELPGELLGQEFIDKVLLLWKRAYSLFEKHAAQLPADLLSESKNYVRNRLHPYLIEAPFIKRAFLKPRGYAGDYEMMNMLLKPEPLGEMAFDQLAHMLFVLPGIARSVRNRSDVMTDYLSVYHSDFAREQDFRILSVACGPAWEIERFLKTKPSGRIDITLVDHDREALDYASGRIEKVAAELQLDVVVHPISESVFKILKQARKGEYLFEKDAFHVAYSAGIMDYLSDSICTELIGNLLRSLHRHGVFFTTNMHPLNPEKYLMEYILDWHLIYRDEEALQALSPVLANRVFTDDTGINVFLEVKPLKNE